MDHMNAYSKLLERLNKTIERQEQALADSKAQRQAVLDMIAPPATPPQAKK